MKKILQDPFFWFSLLAVLDALILLFRGLKSIRWKNFARIFICLTCISAALILFPYAAPIKLTRFIIAVQVISVSVVVVIDVILGLFLAAKRSFLTGKDFATPLPDYLTEICRAMEILVNLKTGALIVLRRNDRLDDYVSSGILFDSQIKSEVIIALFSESSPVHDGAVVVANGRIRRVKTILSLKTDGDVPMGIGTRHRSALGITEKTDAIALVVSEERGEMSVVFRGCLVKASSTKELYRLIKTALKGKSIASIQKDF